MLVKIGNNYINPALIRYMYCCDASKSKYIIMFGRDFSTDSLEVILDSNQLNQLINNQEK